MIDCDLRSLGFSSGETGRIIAAQPWIAAAAEESGVHPLLIHAITWIESRFVASAYSSAGAIGMMQLLPATARAMAAELGLPYRPEDPAINIRLGTRFLAKLLRRYEADTSLAAAAYFAGPGRVPKGGPVPAVARGYVDNMRSALRRFHAAQALCESGNARPFVPTISKGRPLPRSMPKKPGPRTTPASQAGGGGALVLLALALLGKGIA